MLIERTTHAEGAGPMFGVDVETTPLPTGSPILAARPSIPERSGSPEPTRVSEVGLVRSTRERHCARRSINTVSGDAGDVRPSPAGVHSWRDGRDARSSVCSARGESVFSAGQVLSADTPGCDPADGITVIRPDVPVRSVHAPDVWHPKTWTEQTPPSRRWSRGASVNGTPAKWRRGDAPAEDGHGRERSGLRSLQLIPSVCPVPIFERTVGGITGIRLGKTR